MNTLTLLALETSSQVCEVALLCAGDGEPVVNTAAHEAQADHAQHLLPLAQDLLRQTGLARRDVGAVAFGAGPGGFTGLRVGCGVAQGLGYGLSVPVLPVVSLLAMAAEAAALPDVATALDQDACFLVVQDARMEEVYLALYAPPAQAGEPWGTRSAPQLMALTDVAGWVQQVKAQSPHIAWYALGDAGAAYPALSAALAELEWLPVKRPSAAWVARLAWQDFQRGGGLPAAQAQPLYVREKVAFTTQEREGGLGGNPRAGAPALMLTPMREGDLDAVAAIEASVQDFPWSRRSFEEGLDSGYEGWVAWRGNERVGFCLAMHAPDVTHILTLGVAPSAQRQGVGSKLLTACASAAASHGLPALLLEVRVGNQQARSFYQRHGFEQLAVRKDYYPAPHQRREDALVLRSMLPKEPASVGVGHV